MAVKNDIDIPLVLVIGAIGALLLVVTLIGLRAWYTFETDRLTAEKNEDYAPPELLELKAEQAGHLAGGFWISDDRGERAAAAIPIGTAMALVADAGGKPTTLPARRPRQEAAGDADDSTTRPATETVADPDGTGGPELSDTDEDDARDVGDGSGPAGLPPTGPTPPPPAGAGVSQPEPGSDPN